MGGFGSGRQDGRLKADSCLRIDIGVLVREGAVREGYRTTGQLQWTHKERVIVGISFEADATDCDNAMLKLNYRYMKDESAESHEQIISLVYTLPHYGGKRWWMICPDQYVRVGKLYKPPRADRFASRHTWRLGYQSQREPPRYRPLETLFRLQRKLNSPIGFDKCLRRPKGMWHRTYERHLARFEEIQQTCAIVMSRRIAQLRK